MSLIERLTKDIERALAELDLSPKIISVQRTGDSAFGDYTTNLAMQIGREIKQSPMQVAKKITGSIDDLPYLEKLEVKEPGYINFFIKKSEWQEQVNVILKQKERYGSNDSAKGKKARVEFVSANPTGPLHFGNARGGPIGDSLASVLEFSGYDVVREYYHNDIGVQVQKLGESIMNVAGGNKIDDQEYKGEYIFDVIDKIKKISNVKFPISNAEEVGKAAVKLLLEEAIEDSRALGITFDEVYAESEFLSSGKTQESVEKLRKFTKEKDGALWFAPSDDFLKDRETVLVKSDGSYTYFANDIAYHDVKFSDDPDLVIDVFGANHHGHVPRLQAAISSLGYDVSKFHVISYQWVRFLKEGELAKMSKRTGTILTLKEVVDAVGRDATRFFILMHDPNSPIDFDLELAREKSNKNPVYYVQYAVARIHSILAKSKVSTTLKLSGVNKSQKSKVNYELLSSDYELELIKQITRLPELVEDISKSFKVHQLTTYAVELADSFHRFYENCRVIGEDKEISSARLDLCKATQIVLRNTLNLLGVSAPEKM